MSSVTISKEDNELRRVTWKTQICGSEKTEIVINRLSSRYQDYCFKVVCSYTLTSGCLKTGPCEFRVRLTLKVDESSRKDDQVPDYCNRPFAVWGNVNSSSLKHTGQNWFIKSHNTNDWISKTFLINFPAAAQEPKIEDVEYYAVGISHFMNTLILNCEMCIQFQICVCHSELQLVKQLTDMFVSQTNCDVHFSFENDQQIGGHIAILSARSPVFAAMFRHNMKEHQRRQADIPDVQFGIFKQLIHFIYSGRLPTPLLEKDAQPLYIAADKYDIVDLKKICVNFLLSHLRVDNCVRLLAWAHLHSIERIKEQAMVFVALHGKEICLQDDWANLIKSYPDLCLVATQQMMANMSLTSLEPKK